MSSCSNINSQPMAIQIAQLGAGLGALQQSKLKQAQDGTKTFTKPKTIFGKLIGGVSGRTAAAEISNMNKSNPVSPKVMSAMSERLSSPVTGGISFGGQAYRMTYLPFVIVAAVVAIFYSMRRRRGTRRR